MSKPGVAGALLPPALPPCSPPTPTPHPHATPQVTENTTDFKLWITLSCPVGKSDVAVGLVVSSL